MLENSKIDFKSGKHYWQLNFSNLTEKKFIQLAGWKGTVINKQKIVTKTNEALTAIQEMQDDAVSG